MLNWLIRVVKRNSFGSSFLLVLLNDLFDRLRGNSHRANGRMGFIRPPEGTGKVIWIVAGSSVQSVLLAAELVGAIRQRRLDVRIVLTYHDEYPKILASRFRGLKKIGFGFGPCDRRTPVRRALRRLNPIGVIYVNDAAASQLQQHVSKANIHSAAIGLPVGWLKHAVELRVDSEAENGCAALMQQWSGVDLLTLLVETQVEPTFGRLVLGDEQKKIWWLAGSDPNWVHGLLIEWMACGLATRDMLLLSFDGDFSADEITKIIDPQFNKIRRTSDWDRRSLEPGTVMWLDDTQWFASASVSASGIHIAGKNDLAFWQSIASGSRVTVTPGCEGKRFWTEKLQLTEVSAAKEVFLYWESLRDSESDRRREGDRLRREFWEIRRHSTRVLDEFLAKVYDW